MKKQLQSFLLFIALCVFGTAYGQTKTGIFISGNHKISAFVSAKDSVLHVYDSLEAGKALMKQWEYHRKEKEDMLKILNEAIKQNQQLKKDLYEIGNLVRKIKL